MAPKRKSEATQRLMPQSVSQAAYVQPSKIGSLGGLKRYRDARQTNQLKRTAQSDLETIDAYTIHKERRRKFERNPVVVLDSRHQFQADLMDVSKILELNKHQKFVLVVIDSFSKRASCVPILDKTEARVRSGFEKVFKELGEPAKLQVDQGK